MTLHLKLKYCENNFWASKKKKKKKALHLLNKYDLVVHKLEAYTSMWIVPNLPNLLLFFMSLLFLFSKP